MYLPRVVEEVLSLAKQLGERLKPQGYEVVAPATGANQNSVFVNNAGPGPFVVCAIKATLVDTPRVQLFADGNALVRGTENDGSEVGIKSSVSLTSKGDIIPAPIVIGHSLRFKTMRAAGGATADRFQLLGFHVSERLASKLRGAGEACWVVLGMPSTGVEVPFTADHFVRLEHLRTRDAAVTGRLMLRAEAHELWPLGISSTANLPTTIDAGPIGDIGITLAPGSRAALRGIAPSAAVTLELSARSWWKTGSMPK
jgi:hypothetical protein